MVIPISVVETVFFTPWERICPWRALHAALSRSSGFEKAATAHGQHPSHGPGELGKLFSRVRVSYPFPGTVPYY